MKTWKIYYFEDGIMKNQIINDAIDKEDAIKIAKEKYNIVALRCELV